MSMIQVDSEDGEMSATITKGFLESNGIKTSIGPENDSLVLKNPILRGPNVTYGIYVNESDVDRAKLLLKERLLPLE